MSAGWSIDAAATFWASRPETSLLQYPVSLRRDQLADRRRDRLQTIENQEDTFLRVHGLPGAQDESIIETAEAEDLNFWARYQSWAFCATCGQLDPRKLLPPYRNRAPTPLFTACKCSTGTYQRPSTDDVPLVLRTLTVADQRLLSPFEVHCGDYRRIFNGYRQRTGPFRVSWSTTLVRDSIEEIPDRDRRERLLDAYLYLLNSPESSYSQFVLYACSCVPRESRSCTKFFRPHAIVALNALSGPYCTSVHPSAKASWRGRTTAPAERLAICISSCHL